MACDRKKKLYTQREVQNANRLWMLKWKCFFDEYGRHDRNV